MSTWNDTRPLHDPAAYANEQTALARHWTLIGMASDLPDINDWFTARLGEQSIFVQRFAEGLRAFVNRCAHRSFPLRIGDKGSGPVVCGFHHWRYNADGAAVGIPACATAFGRQPREMGLYLERVELETCGDLLFARLPGAPSSLSLAEELGPAFGPIAGLYSHMGGSARGSRSVQANWRLVMQISLDDYHLAAVHPKTLGHVGYHKAENLNYYRFGANSAFFSGRDAESLEEMGVAVAAGAFQHRGYRIFHLFPTAALIVFRAYSLMGEHYWYVATQTILPIGPNRCEVQVRVARSPYFEPTSWHCRLMEPAESLRRRLVLRGILRVVDEDRVACEAQQREVRQISQQPIYGRAEQRVGWFDEEYARVTAKGSFPL